MRHYATPVHLTAAHAAPLHHCRPLVWRNHLLDVQQARPRKLRSWDKVWLSMGHACVSLELAACARCPALQALHGTRRSRHHPSPLCLQLRLPHLQRHALALLQVLLICVAQNQQRCRCRPAAMPVPKRWPRARAGGPSPGSGGAPWEHEPRCMARFLRPPTHTNTHNPKR